MQETLPGIIAWATFEGGAEDRTNWPFPPKSGQERCWFNWLG